MAAGREISDRESCAARCPNGRRAHYYVRYAVAVSQAELSEFQTFLQRAGVSRMKPVIVLALVSTLVLTAQAPQYDLLITGGEIMDGTGNPPVRADVAVRGDRIAAVGSLGNASAKRTIDAHAKTIVPGFIDIHSHADDRNGDRRGLRDRDAKRRAAASLVTQGITTVVCNPDGSAPESIRAQKEALKKLGIGPNAILLAGFNTIRAQVMGSDYKRPARPDEIQKMRALVKQALEDGAWGLSAGLEYVPAIWSTTDEVVEVVKEVVHYN